MNAESIKEILDALTEKIMEEISIDKEPIGLPPWFGEFAECKPMGDKVIQKGTRDTPWYHGIIEYPEDKVITVPIDNQNTLKMVIEKSRTGFGRPKDLYIADDLEIEKLLE